MQSLFHILIGEVVSRGRSCKTIKTFSSHSIMTTIKKDIQSQMISSKQIFQCVTEKPKSRLPSKIQETELSNRPPCRAVFSQSIHHQASFAHCHRNAGYLIVLEKLRPVIETLTGREMHIVIT